MLCATRPMPFGPRAKKNFLRETSPMTPTQRNNEGKSCADDPLKRMLGTYAGPNMRGLMQAPRKAVAFRTLCKAVSTESKTSTFAGRANTDTFRREAKTQRRGSRELRGERRETLEQPLSRHCYACSEIRTLSVYHVRRNASLCSA